MDKWLFCGVFVLFCFVLEKGNLYFHLGTMFALKPCRITLESIELSSLIIEDCVLV